MTEFKDTIHGSIKVSTLALKIINTPIFQRLHQVRQLGNVYRVYMGAEHSRFQHSLGVYHLTGLFLEHLNPPLDTKQRETIKIAGLCHDLGHVNHNFDRVLEELLGPDPRCRHEYRSQALLRLIDTEEGLGLDLDLIGRIIDPGPRDCDYRFQIVANKQFEVDMDKMDYLQRDSYNCGVGYTFDPQRIMRHARLRGSNIEFHAKVAGEIEEMFYTRYRLFRRVYSHRVNWLIDYLMRQAIKQQPTFCNFLMNSLMDWTAFSQLVDATFELALPEWMEQVARRQFPRLLYQGSTLPVEFQDSNQYIIQKVTIGFASGSDNPLTKIRFFQGLHHEPVALTEINGLIGTTHQEQIVRVFSR